TTFRKSWRASRRSSISGDSDAPAEDSAGSEEDLLRIVAHDKFRLQPVLRELPNPSAKIIPFDPIEQQPAAAVQFAEGLQEERVPRRDTGNLRERLRANALHLLQRQDRHAEIEAAIGEGECCGAALHEVDAAERR